MSDKTAFVFDTNFIVRHKRIDRVLKELEELGDYTPYVTQISIDERKAQQRRDIKKVYEEASDLDTKHPDYFEVKYILDIDEAQLRKNEVVQKLYEKFFPGKIIPFDKSKETFESVIERANDKLPPFKTDKNASDKGFKDCILWLSLLEFFKKNGEDRILFITDDDAFLKEEEFLCKEFNNVTKKQIEIKSNAHFVSLSTKENEEETDRIDEESTIQNIKALRPKVNSVIYSLCKDLEYDNWGNEHWLSTFETSEIIDSEYTKEIFERLQNVVDKNIFESSINASAVLGIDDRITDKYTSIPMEAIEDALNLYKEIKKKYPNYLEQFFEATAKILNSNYVEPIAEVEIDDLPF